MRTAIIFASILLLSAPAFAGFGSSSVALQAAVQSGSVDAIVAELERAEELPSARRHRRWSCRSSTTVVKRARRRRLVAHAPRRAHAGDREHDRAAVGLRSDGGAQRRRRARRDARLLDDPGARRPTWRTRSTRTRAWRWPSALGAIGHPSALPALQTARSPRRWRGCARRRRRRCATLRAPRGSPWRRRRRRCCRCSTTPTPTCAGRRSSRRLHRRQRRRDGDRARVTALSSAATGDPVGHGAQGGGVGPRRAQGRLGRAGADAGAGQRLRSASSGRLPPPRSAICGKIATR